MKIVLFLLVATGLGVVVAFLALVVVFFLFLFGSGRVTHRAASKKPKEKQVNHSARGEGFIEHEQT